MIPLMLTNLIACTLAVTSVEIMKRWKNWLTITIAAIFTTVSIAMLVVTIDVLVSSI